ncbi:MAG: winged helix-turn-helix transcriptional regulator [Armatimonadetes bacterium]|nr:winged helix-turn-helix transcriptional regulator [Armatimonadota bacterium]
MDVAELFRALSDETRLRIVNLLSRGRAMAVCDLVAAMEMPQWHISRHLSRLLQAGVVRAQRSGARRYYSLRDDVQQVVANIMAAVRDKLDQTTMGADLQRLTQLLRRESIPDA